MVCSHFTSFGFPQPSSLHVVFSHCVSLNQTSDIPVYVLKPDNRFINLSYTVTASSEDRSCPLDNKIQYRLAFHSFVEWQIFLALQQWSRLGLAPRTKGTYLPYLPRPNIGNGRVFQPEQWTNHLKCSPAS